MNLQDHWPIPDRPSILTHRSAGGGIISPPKRLAGLWVIESFAGRTPNILIFKSIENTAGPTWTMK
jgi:hypothetical protein